MVIGDNVELEIIRADNNTGATAGGLLQTGFTTAIPSELTEVALHLLYGNIGYRNHRCKPLCCNICYIQRRIPGGMGQTGQRNRTVQRTAGIRRIRFQAAKQTVHAIKTAAGNSAKQGSAKHKGDSPLEERWSFGSSPLGCQRLSGALRKGFRVIFIIAIHTLLLLSDELLTGIPPFSLLPV